MISLITRRLGIASGEVPTPGPALRCLKTWKTGGESGAGIRVFLDPDLSYSTFPDVLQRFEIARNWKSISSVRDDEGLLVLKEKRKKELLERFSDILDPQFVYEIEHLNHR
jgi:hypothetical protein